MQHSPRVSSLSVYPYSNLMPLPPIHGFEDSDINRITDILWQFGSATSFLRRAVSHFPGQVVHFS
jgi:hypothetical protein